MAVRLRYFVLEAAADKIPRPARWRRNVRQCCDAHWQQRGRNFVPARYFRATAYTYNYNAANQIVGRSSSNPNYLWLPEENKSDDYGVVNGLNQYSSVTVDGTARALSYNAQANLTADGVHTYKYDAINRMFRSDDLVSLFYNAADQLHLIDDYGNGARRRLLYDGESMVVEYAGNGTLLRRYIHGLARDGAQTLSKIAFAIGD